LVRIDTQLLEDAILQGVVELTVRGYGVIAFNEVFIAVARESSGKAQDTYKNERGALVFESETRASAERVRMPSPRQPAFRTS